MATQTQINHLEKLYEGRQVFHGELHDHSNSGGTSDGGRTLSHWLGAMEALEMDFATILDHKQVRHMYQPEWEDGVFIGGTEPGAHIIDAVAEDNHLHYNMIFADPEELMKTLEAFPEYEFTGGPEGHFIYPDFTRERFSELADTVFENGGFFVHPHPMLLMKADDPSQYVFREKMGIEAIYISYDSEDTKKNHKLWCDILALGHKVYATAGCDLHNCCRDTALTTIYADEKKSRAYIQRLREGDFVAGSVGIKMCIGDTKMGGTTPFSGKELVVSVGDFHKGVSDTAHKYRLDIITDKGTVRSENIPCDTTSYFALDVDADAKFYRTEVVDETKDLIIAIGNPIWNE